MNFPEYDKEFAEQVFHVPTEIEKQFGLWIHLMGKNLAKENYRSGPKFLKNYSIHIVLDGSLHLQCHSQSHLLQAGDLFCMVPDVSYTYYVKHSPRHLRMQWLAFDGPLAPQVIGLMGASIDHPVLIKRGSPALQTIMDDLMEHIRTHTSGGSLLALSKLIEFFHLLCEDSLTQQKTADHTIPTWLDTCLSYMDTHFAEGITTEQVADWVGVSRTHFSKTFTRCIGDRPANYLMKLRMNEARTLLISTSYQIKEIALSLGYSDPYSFSRAFTKWYRTSPHNYRSSRGGTC